MELVVDGLDDYGEGRALRVPAVDRWSSVLNGDRIERRMSHCRHHVDLRRDHWELIGQSDLDVKRGRRDRELQGDTVLDILSCLSVQDDIGIHLAELVDLDVGHRRIIVHHLLTRLHLRRPLAGQHIVVCTLHFLL